jgi:hypothetical protein
MKPFVAALFVAQASAFSISSSQQTRPPISQLSAAEYNVVEGEGKINLKVRDCISGPNESTDGFIISYKSVCFVLTIRLTLALVVKD